MFKVVQEDVCNLRWEAWEVRTGVQALVALVVDGCKFISSLLNPMLSFLCDTAHTAHGLLRGDVRECAPGWSLEATCHAFTVLELTRPSCFID